MLDMSCDDDGMLHVKLSIRGLGPIPDISQFVGNKENEWDGCVFHVNQHVQSADVWFVSEDVNDDDTDCAVPPSRVVFLTAETSWEPGFYASGTVQGQFLNSFARVSTCHDILHPGTEAALPYLPWMINSNHGATMFAANARDVRQLSGITSIPKSRPLSVFCSTQTLTANHRMRLRFVERMKEHFGDTLDWYGNGINPVATKWEGIAPYRYTMVLENQSTTNVITEKLYDAYLGLAFPLYWGAPNAGEFFDPSSFVPMNIRDLKGSIAKTEELLAGTLAEDRLPQLLESKARVLGELNLFKRLSRLAREIVSETATDLPQAVTIEPWSRGQGSNPLTPREHLGHLITRAGRRIGGRPQ